MTFHVRQENGPSLRFLSRPGVFSYGRFDDGARALVETMTIQPEDRIVDVGCGCGTNGAIAGLRSGPDGYVAFVDSNVRATALAEHNARQNGLLHFQAFANCRVEGPEENSFDVALSNPPYCALQSIARLFVERSRQLLKRGGRFYLVTKSPEQVKSMVAEAFERVEAILRRGFVVLCGEVA